MIFKICTKYCRGDFLKFIYHIFLYMWAKSPLESDCNLFDKCISSIYFVQFIIETYSWPFNWPTLWKTELFIVNILQHFWNILSPCLVSFLMFHVLYIISCMCFHVLNAWVSYYGCEFASHYWFLNFFVQIYKYRVCLFPLIWK